MRTLFLFSKYFPYSNGEQYIENELPYLAKDFDEILIYPTDWFGGAQAHARVLPSNAKILDLNAQLQPLPKSVGDLWFILRLAIYELVHAPRFFKELVRLRYLLRIAVHQFHTAKNLHRLLQKEFTGRKVYLYSYWAHNNCLMLAAMKKKNWIGQYVTRAHSIDLYYYDWALADVLKVPSYEYTKSAYASHVYTISKHGETYFKKKFPAWAQKVTHAYLGVSDLGENPHKAGTFTIVTCSNLSANKRLLELAKAVQQLDITMKWVHFGDGEQRAAIEAVAASLPPSRQIEIRGQTPNEEVRNYLVHSSADVFVNLSQAEGLPVSLMEAASAGIPLIATNVYGNPEIAVEGVTGCIITENFTTSELCTAIGKLYHNKELRVKLSAGARQHYLRSFNDKDNYTRFSQALLQYPNQIN